MFSQFALHERLLKAVAELKFVEPTPVQAAAIPLALQGRDLRVTAQTGSGKTAAFVLPVLNRLIGPAKVRVSIKTLILLPTRELAQQTLKEVERFSQFTFIKSGIITGGEDFKVQAAMLRKVPMSAPGVPAPMIPLDDAIRIATQRIPGLEASFVSLPLNAYSHLQIGGRGWYPLMYQTAQINPYDGDIAAAHLLSDRSKLEFVTESMRPLHTGDFGGLWIKLIWAFFGLIMSMMVLSGLLIWTKRTALATLNAFKREAKAQRKPVSIAAMPAETSQAPQ